MELGKITVDPFDSSEEEQKQKAIFVSTFSMLSLLATVDGQVGKDEIQMIDKFMKNVLGLDAERRAFAIQVFNDARRSDTTFVEHAKQYYELLQEKPKMLEWMVDILLKISCVDRNFSDAEKRLVKEACKIFGISSERFEEMVSKYVKRPAKEQSDEGGSKDKAQRAPAAESSPYAVLRISEQASNEEIQSQYKKLAEDYNPSRIVELGLPEEFSQLAEEKLREFQKAYRTLKAERGF